MADIVIRGIDMPKGDLEYLSLWVYGDGRVYVSNKASAAYSRRLQDFAVPLPAGHGSLIDADAFAETIRQAFGIGCASILDLIEEAEPIVPAEGGEADG